MSKFQVILLALFGFLIVLAVLLFSFVRGSNSVSATVSVWGSITRDDFNSLANSLRLSQNDLSFRYTEVGEESISQELVEALALGAGPDLIILPQDKLWGNRDKLIPIPYENISERDFKSTFVEEGELFLGQAGVYGLPLVIDPLVLYYNRDHISAAGKVSPIAYWDEFYAASVDHTRKDAARNITKSAMALGEARNIEHYKDILSLLMLQAGTPITSLALRSGREELRPMLTGNFNMSVSPSISAVDFYTQFSDPSKPYNSWNRSLPLAETHFTRSDSTYYLGYASELVTLRAKNPTLNLGVARVPQSRVSERPTTFGRVYAVSITRGTKSPQAALMGALKLVSRDISGGFSSITGMPSARRDLLGANETDEFKSLFNESALQARGWLDPDDTGTALAFRDLIESVTSGRARSSEAVSEANRDLDNLINQ